MVDDDNWEEENVAKEDDNWEEDEDSKKTTGEWHIVESQDGTSPVPTPEAETVPGAETTEKDRETLLPPPVGELELEEEPVEKEAKPNSWTQFGLKNFSDVEAMINRFVRPKLYPETEKGVAKLKAKKAHLGVLRTAMDTKFGQLELGEMDKFLKEVQKLKAAAKISELAAQKEAIKKQAADVEALKKSEDEVKQLAALAKGENYQNDEDFFAGLE